MDKPDPGTPEAIRGGCICPPTKLQPIPKVTINAHTYDWMCVVPICPMHGWRVK